MPTKMVGPGSIPSLRFLGALLLRERWAGPTASRLAVRGATSVVRMDVADGSAPSRSASRVSENIGALAQLGEHLLCKQRVIGSIPIGSTIPEWSPQSIGRMVIEMKECRRAYGSQAGANGSSSKTRSTSLPLRSS